MTGAVWLKYKNEESKNPRLHKYHYGDNLFHCGRELPTLDEITEIIPEIPGPTFEDNVCESCEIKPQRKVGF